MKNEIIKWADDDRVNREMSCVIIKTHDEAPYKGLIDLTVGADQRYRGRTAAQEQHMLSEAVQLLCKPNVPENSVTQSINIFLKNQTGWELQASVSQLWYVQTSAELLCCSLWFMLSNKDSFKDCFMSRTEQETGFQPFISVTSYWRRK